MSVMQVDELMFWGMYTLVFLLGAALVWIYLWTGGITFPLMWNKFRHRINVLRTNLPGHAKIVAYKAEDGGLVPINKKDDVRFSLTQEDRIILPNNNPIYLSLDVVGYTQPMTYLNNINHLHQMGFNSYREAEDFLSYALLESQRDEFIGLKQEDAAQKAQELLRQGWEDLRNYNLNQKTLTFIRQSLNPRFTLNLALANKFAASKLNPAFIKGQEERKLSVLRAEQNKMTQKELMGYIIIAIVIMAAAIVLLKMAGPGTMPQLPGLGG